MSKCKYCYITTDCDRSLIEFVKAIKTITPITTEKEQVFEIGGSACVYVNKDRLYLHNNVNDEEDDEIYYRKINYCPMCGRKLEHADG